MTDPITPIHTPMDKALDEWLLSLHNQIDIDYNMSPYESALKYIQQKHPEILPVNDDEWMLTHLFSEHPIESAHARQMAEGMQNDRSNHQP